jgi:hypothetical protein
MSKLSVLFAWGIMKNLIKSLAFWLFWDEDEMLQNRFFFRESQKSKVLGRNQKF